MCDYALENLIDLSIEDDNPRTGTPSIFASKTAHTTMTGCLITPPAKEGESFENNPFDQVHKLATTAQDPYESVELEACLKASRSKAPPSDVKVGKLLSLSVDNLQDHTDSLGYNSHNNSGEFSVPKADSDSTMARTGSSIYHTALAQELENESPPISMSMKSTPDTDSSAPYSGSASSADSKVYKAAEYRKRLLKLSISNSTFNSPVSRGIPRQSDSGYSMAFSEAAQYSDHMLASESPLKLVDEEGNMGEPSKPSKGAETDFDADLELMNIPILKQLPSPQHKRKQFVSVKKAENQEKGIEALPGLAEIREKLRARRGVINKEGEDVQGLIENLKLLLCDNEVVDQTKKQQANSLLEKLSFALSAEGRTDSLNVNPQPIARQGTFDFELHDGLSAKDEKENANTSANSASTYSVNSLSPYKEIPEAMIKSSATYDGEPIAERENLLLPHVEVHSPELSSNAELTAITSQPDINDIIEQLGKLLEHHHHLQSDNTTTSGNGTDISSIINPTFIVVMPSNNANQSHIETASNEQPLDANLSIRRRSQSLSIHDKLKIVQLHDPQIATPVPEKKSSGCPTTITINNNSSSSGEFKTPMRRMVRRNSYSNGTPYTPLTTAHRTVNARRLQGTSEMGTRYHHGLSTHQERSPKQQQAIVRPFPNVNLNSFRPDLKKKCNKTSTTNSIMKSNGPMKAIIPVKKLAPMLKCNTKPSPMDTSMHLLTPTPVRGPNACSTPAVPVTPVRRSIATIKNPRFSTTPACKQPAPTGTTMTGLKKRQTPEVRAKSPLKSRASLIPTGAGTKSTNKPVLTTKLGHMRPSTRLSARASFCGSVVTNKENKKP